jgi:hypothetical protein
MTMVGTNAVAVAPMTKDKIKDHLCQKYIAAQEIRKEEYDDNPPYDCWSNEEEEKLMKKLELFEYPHGGMFATKHPIDLAMHCNVSYIDAFPNMQLRPPQGWWVCPLSNQAREWRRKNDFDIKVHCGGNCSTNYDSCQSLKNNLWARGRNIMHQYTLKFLEEWWKQ